MGFRMRGLPAEPFAELFSLSDEALAVRFAKPGCYAALVERT